MMDWLIRASCRARADTPEPTPEGVEVRYAGWLPSVAGVLAGFVGPAAAVTLGRTIVVHPSVPVTPELLRHELAHVRQWQENRWTFPVRYVLNHFKYGYHSNPYEVAAREAENQNP